MHSISALGLIYASSAALLFTTYGLLSRVLARDSADPLSFSVLYGLYATIFSVAILPFEPWKFGALTLGVLLLTFLATLFYGLYQGSEFFARKNMEASRMTILFQLTPVITFVCAIAFLHESFSVPKLIAILLIIGGNLVASYKHGGHLTPRGLFFGMITVIFLAFGYIVDKNIFELYPLGIYMAITYFFPSIYGSFFIAGRRRSLVKEACAGTWRLPLLSLVGVAGYYFLLKSFTVLEASVAVPIIYTSTILTGIGGILILKERSSIIQKIIGAVLVFGGVVLLR